MTKLLYLLNLLNNPQLHNTALLPLHGPTAPLGSNAPVLQLWLSPLNRAGQPVAPKLVLPDKILRSNTHAAGSRVRRESGVAPPFLVEVVADAADAVVDGVRAHIQAAERAAFLVAPGQEGAGVGVDGDGGAVVFGGAEVPDVFLVWEGMLVA
jgi:hypothetical protein